MDKDQSTKPDLAARLIECSPHAIVSVKDKKIKKFNKKAQKLFGYNEKEAAALERCWSAVCRS